MRWNLVPRNCNFLPRRVVLPMLRPTKLATVFGTTSPKRLMTNRPTGSPPIARSMKVRSVTFGGSAAVSDG